MKLKVIVHEAEEGGYWAEVPAIPGCATQGDTFDELLKNLYDAVEGCLSVDVKDIQISPTDKVLDIAVGKAFREKISVAYSKGTGGSGSEGPEVIIFYAKPGDPARISVPVHGNTSLKIGLLRHLMKLSGISEDELGSSIRYVKFLPIALGEHRLDIGPKRVRESLAPEKGTRKKVET